MQSNISINTSRLKKNYDAVRAILSTGELFAVGGCVRDTLLGDTPKDWDYTTNLTPDEMEPLIRSAGRRVYETGRRFGTLGFKVEVDGIYELVEVTTYRTEYYDGNTRKPEVVWAKNLKDDLSRRDFTINAIAYDGKDTIDPFGGRLDLYKGLIKSVGLPKDRILEDALRIFRAARFAARYGFKIDPNFIGKARQLADRIFDVSVERWVMELDKTLTSQSAYIGIDELHKMGVLQRVLPELYSDESHTNPFDCCGEIKVYDDANEAWKFLLYNVHTPRDIKEPTRVTRFINTGICHRLKFSNARRDIILK